jgi:hypothetical protein
MSYDYQRKSAGTIGANDIAVQRQILAGNADRQKHWSADQPVQQSAVFGMRNRDE